MLETVAFHISGMVCGGCASSVTQALQALPGVVQVEVSLGEAKAEIHFDPALVQIEQLKSAVARAGYQVAA
jgi:copper chaperone CopZ